MDDTPITETSIENLNLEIKGSRATKSNDERFILNLHVQILFQKLEGKNALEQN